MPGAGRHRHRRNTPIMVRGVGWQGWLRGIIARALCVFALGGYPLRQPVYILMNIDDPPVGADKAGRHNLAGAGALVVRRRQRCHIDAEGQRRCATWGFARVRSTT